MLSLSTRAHTGGLSDSESDDDPNLGRFKPVRLFHRSATPSNVAENQFSFHHLKANGTDGLGDFGNLISHLREQGAFPNLPSSSISSLGPVESKNKNVESQSSTLVKYHTNSLSNSSDATTTSHLSSAAYTTPPSSPDDGPTRKQRHTQQHKGKEVRWTESVTNKSKSEDKIVKQKPLAPSYKLFGQKSSDDFGSPSSAVPPLPLKRPYLDPTEIQPKFTLTLGEKQIKLIKKLSKKFSNEPAIVGDPEQIIDLASNKSKDGIHIFVDLSNILIGFAEQLKADRKIPKASYRRQPPIAFHSFAMVLERGRKVARRVIAGSSTHTSATPGYLLEATACGYELNMLERVRKPKPIKPGPPRHHKKATSSGSGYATGGNSSASESGTALANTEQAVDEILHLKMMESILDTAKPSTMVVASGDAARAEYSGGFLAMILRALKRGWKVEVVSWNQNLSSDYKQPTFLKTWQKQFKVVLLDDYCEEMLAIYAEKFIMMDMNSYKRLV